MDSPDELSGGFFAYMADYVKRQTGEEAYNRQEVKKNAAYCPGGVRTDCNML